MPHGRFKTLAGLALVVCVALSGCACAPRRVTPLVVPPPVQQAAGITGFYHTVERGQTLYRIAKNYNADWHELM